MGNIIKASKNNTKSTPKSKLNQIRIDKLTKNNNIRNAEIIALRQKYNIRGKVSKIEILQQIHPAAAKSIREWLMQNIALTEIATRLDNMSSVPKDLIPSPEALAHYKKNKLANAMQVNEIQENANMSLADWKVLGEKISTAIGELKDKYHPLVRLLAMAKRLEKKTKELYTKKDASLTLPYNLINLENQLRIVYGDIYKMMYQNSLSDNFILIQDNNGLAKPNKEYVDNTQPVESSEEIRKRFIAIINSRRYRKIIDVGELNPAGNDGDSEDRAGNSGSIVEG